MLLTVTCTSDEWDNLQLFLASRYVISSFFSQYGPCGCRIVSAIVDPDAPVVAPSASVERSTAPPAGAGINVPWFEALCETCTALRGRPAPLDFAHEHARADWAAEHLATHPGHQIVLTHSSRTVWRDTSGDYLPSGTETIRE